MMTVWLVLTHGLALLVLVVTGIHALPGVVISAAMLVFLYRAYTLHARRSHPAAIRRLVWKAGSECLLTLHSGEQQTAMLQQRVFVMPWLVILHIKSPAGRSCHIALLPDMLDHEVFRRLRVRLTIESPQGGARAT